MGIFCVISPKTPVLNLVGQEGREGMYRENVFSIIICISFQILKHFVKKGLILYLPSCQDRFRITVWEYGVPVRTAVVSKIR